MGGMQSTGCSVRTAADATALLRKLLTAINAAPIDTDAAAGTVKARTAWGCVSAD
jgi:hypothetical protein